MIFSRQPSVNQIGNRGGKKKNKGKKTYNHHSNIIDVFISIQKAKHEKENHKYSSQRQLIRNIHKDMLSCYELMNNGISLMFYAPKSMGY